MYNYYQIDGGEERWKACPVGLKSKVAHDSNPMFFTVLAVSKMPEELEYDEKLKLKYDGPFYADWDGTDIAYVATKFNAYLDKLEELGLDLSMASLYATGGKGFHLEVPPACFMEKVPKDGVQSLPTIYREMALETVVDTLDLRVYSQGMGRMWRCANKLRPNGKYKVGITLAEARAMTVELYEEACSAPRAPIVPKPPQLCLDLALLYAKAQQKVDEKIKKRGKTKPDPHQKAKAGGPSIGLMAMGQGIRADAGFQQIATQLAIAATTAGTALETFLQDCEGIITSHDGDGTRYNTPAKRSAELQRMYNYVDGNPCYEFSVGAIKVLLTHPAPDLDGISVDRADLIEGIVEAEADAADLSEAPDEYADVAASVTLSKYGIYVSSEEGKRRVCAVSFCATNLLISCDTGYITMYETTVLVNGKDMGRRSLEVDVFATVMGFNKFCATLGHAYSGTELQLRGTFMRFVEQAKKKGGVQYLTKREGLDVVSIPGHENEELRKPFLVWASNRGVLLDPRVSGMGMQMQFKGFPDPQGQFKTDLADAPKLLEWIADDANKAALKRTLTGLLTCQTPEMLSKMIGWYTACFWRMLFHRAYDKFPLLHVVGAAGSGKSEMNMAMLSLFYYETDPKSLSPTSSVFSIEQHLAGSSSIPLMLDEYKPHAMPRDLHNRFKSIIRDAYNCKDVTKGGGTRENADYRMLHHVQLSAPMLFIAEAAEDEAAVMERVVLLSVIKPAASVAARRSSLFQIFRANKKHLSILGQYLASQVLNLYDVAKLREEFDEMYELARDKYLLTDKDAGSDMESEEMVAKSHGKERSVFNYTVAKFGFAHFRALVNKCLPGDTGLDGLMESIENAVYEGMHRLQQSTMPEYLKVLSMMSTMSYAVDPMNNDSLRRGREYDFATLGGSDVMELSARTAYIRYRMYCRASSMVPLFPSHESFIMSLKDSSSLVKHGTGTKIHEPGVFTFRVDELARLGVDPFKP